MPDMTVAEYAERLKISPDALMTRLTDAGINVKSVEDTMSEEAKQSLLGFLRTKNKQAATGTDTAAVPKKGRRITLKRRSQSEIKTSGSQGRARTVNIEVRSKRTYVKRDVFEEEARENMQELEQERAAIDTQREEERKAQEAIRSERAQVEEQEQAKEQAEIERKREEVAEAKRKLDQEEKDRRSVKEKEEREARKMSRFKRKELHVSSDKAGRRRKKKVTGRRLPSSLNVDSKHGFEMPTAPVVREVLIPEAISVSDLAQRMAVKANELIKELMKQGVMATINQTLDQETAQIIVEELGHTPKLVNENEVEDQILSSENEQDLEQFTRPPVVTIMGHVDHGKTSLLDYIRSTKVIDGEAGGITQHIGAYQVSTDKGMITFLDTPGHAAFTAMRARGAEVTDIVVLIVAADDGVMPQTEEAVKHAKAAGVPIVVAVNKMDKEGADPDRVKTELSNLDVLPEDWGGDVQFVNISAKKGDNIEALLEAIALQAEILELKAPTEGTMSGSVIESSLEKGRGAVATVLVGKGTLKVGDMLIAGSEYGRVRALFNDAGQSVKEAGPSMPIAVLGLSGTPFAGDDAQVVINERKAREVTSHRQNKHRDNKLATQQAARIEEAMSSMGAADMTVINVLVKADVQGSAEALKQALSDITTEDAKVNVVSTGVGGINESDVNLAMASNAMVIGFNVRADNAARQMLKDNDITPHYFSVIYEAIDAAKLKLEGMLSPEEKENIVGIAQVLQVFRVSKLGQVAGCRVEEGYVKRNLPIRVLRDNVVIFEGKLESLKREKDDVNEVRSGTECGIGVKNYNDVQIGDQIECFERTTVNRTID